MSISDLATFVAATLRDRVVEDQQEEIRLLQEENRRLQASLQEAPLVAIEELINLRFVDYNGEPLIRVATTWDSILTSVYSLVVSQRPDLGSREGYYNETQIMGEGTNWSLNNTPIMRGWANDTDIFLLDMNYAAVEFPETNWPPCVYKVCVDAPMGGRFGLFARYFQDFSHLNRADFQFTYNGQVVSDTDTMRTLGLEDVDEWSPASFVRRTLP